MLGSKFEHKDLSILCSPIFPLSSKSQRRDKDPSNLHSPTFPLSPKNQRNNIIMIITMIMNIINSIITILHIPLYVYCSALPHFIFNDKMQFMQPSVLVEHLLQFGFKLAAEGGGLEKLRFPLLRQYEREQHLF